MAAEVETLTKTRDNLLTQSERLVIQTTKLEKEIVEHRQQLNSNKNMIQQLEKLKQRNFYNLCLNLKEPSSVDFGKTFMVLRLNTVVNEWCK